MRTEAFQQNWTKVLTGFILPQVQPNQVCWLQLGTRVRMFVSMFTQIWNNVHEIENVALARTNWHFDRLQTQRAAVKGKLFELVSSSKIFRLCAAEIESPFAVCNVILVLQKKKVKSKDVIETNSISNSNFVPDFLPMFYTDWTDWCARVTVCKGRPI